MSNAEPGGAPPSATERALYGPVSAAELRAFLNSWVRRRLGSPIAGVAFRAGRIDAVWGVHLEDGRAVVVKTHRPPADLAAIATAVEAQQVLVEAGYPCAVPLAGPDEVDGHVLTAETLLAGTRPDGREPAIRRVLADGLARHVRLLRPAGLAARVGPGPSWCRYQAGPWPEPHDSLVDFTATPAGYEWLDDLGRHAARRLRQHRDADRVVVGHADWYAGNTAVVGHRLVGTFDWQLAADTEAVLAGFAAAAYASSASAGGGLSTPGEAGAFLRDYDSARGAPLDAGERRTAAAATAWIIAFNARWQVGLIPHGLCDEPSIGLARDHGAEYLALEW